MFYQVSSDDLSTEILRAKYICSQRGLNYYQILSLKSNCDVTEIKDAYRLCAIRYNPALQKNEGAQAIFALAAEAYDVLSDPLRRAVYDQYGEEGLKNGVPRPEGFVKPYVYHGDPMRTFREFFTIENLCHDLLLILRNPQLLIELLENQYKEKEEPIIKTLFLSLSEVFFGGIKKMKIQKLVLVGDDKSTTLSMEKILTIPIKPGIPPGTKIVFPEEGDQGLTKTPVQNTVSVADIIFITKDRPHKTFRRENSDLYMMVDIFLKEALTGTVITFNTIDERTLRIPITSITAPNYVKRVPGEGMPFPGNPKKRGDLILKFNIEFPIYLPLSSKNYIKKAFKASRSNEKIEYIHRLISVDKICRNIDDDVPLR